MHWDLQSALMSLTANINIPKGKKKTTPADFNPLLRNQPKAQRNKSPMLDLATTAGLPPDQIAELERRLAEKERRRRDNPKA